jgi:hypothetical protein
MAQDEDHVAESVSTAEGLPPEGILELDHVYDAVGHPRRRYLCYTLLAETEWSLTDLATKIAAWEGDVPEHAVPVRHQETVYVSLYHAHVPKLVEDDIITFDAMSETIRPAENAPQVLHALNGMGASLDASQETHARREMNDHEE